MCSGEHPARLRSSSTNLGVDVFGLRQLCARTTTSMSGPRHLWDRGDVASWRPTPREADRPVDVDGAPADDRIGLSRGVLSPLAWHGRTFRAPLWRGYFFADFGAAARKGKRDD